jgi:PAS domain S-box-containing protein
MGAPPRADRLCAGVWTPGLKAMRAPSSTPPAGHTLAAHLESLLESVPVCLARVAQDGTLLAVNEAGLVLLGADGLGRVLGTPLQRYASDETACRRFVERIAGGERGSLELEVKSLAGHVSTVQVNATPIPTPIDGVRSALLVFRDVSEQRRLERSVMESAAGRGGPSPDPDGLASAVARIEELEQALQEAERRRLELEALLGARDGFEIELDDGIADDTQPPTRTTSAKGKGSSWRS